MGMSIRNNPRVYAAAGASIIAAAVATRYVAKWRKRRYMRRGEGIRDLGGGQVFIGLDLTDPYASSSRPCDYAILDTDLNGILSETESVRTQRTQRCIGIYPFRLHLRRYQ